MKQRWWYIAAVVAGIACGLCVAFLIFPERAKVQEETIPPAKVRASAQIAALPPTSTVPVVTEKVITPLSGPTSTSLLFLGDMMFDRNVATRSKAAGSLDYPFKKICNQTDCFFKGYDLVVANLEGPISSKRQAPNKGNVDFMFDSKILAVLKQVGINAVSQANNHTWDQGRAEADASQQKVRQASIGVFGDQIRDSVASASAIVESNGRNIALLGYNVTDHALDKQAVSQAITSAKKQADFTVVFMHWGVEYQAKPNKSQIELAHWLIDQGVDAVIGGHPHWMQSVEVYRNRPIAYSLGNFIFDQDFSAETRFGLMVNLVLNSQGSELQLFPIRIDKSQPVLLIDQERQVRLDRLASISDKSLSASIKTGVIKIIK
ncbi:MAG: CapA family protein [Patescibacteria group bacterium]